MPAAQLLKTIPSRTDIFSVLQRLLADRITDVGRKRQECEAEKRGGDGSTDREEQGAYAKEVSVRLEAYDQELQDTCQFVNALNSSIYQDPPGSQMLGRFILVEEEDMPPECWFVYAKNGEFDNLDKDSLQQGLKQDFELDFTLVSESCELIQTAIGTEVPIKGGEIHFTPRGQQKITFKVLDVA